MLDSDDEEICEISYSSKEAFFQTLGVYEHQSRRYVQGLSFMSTCTIEEVASSCNVVRFFQLYVYKKHDISALMVKRAEANGFKAIILTVDTPKLGRREAEIKNKMIAPQLKNFEGLVSTKVEDDEGSNLEAFAARSFDPSLSWKVNQLLQVAQKCRSTISDGGSDGVSQQDLQTNIKIVATAGEEFGVTIIKRFRIFQKIREVFTEGLKSYPRQLSTGTAKLEMGQMSSLQVNSPVNSGQMVNRGALLSGSGSQQSALTLTNYQNMLMRQKSMNSNSQQESSPQGWGLQNNRVSGGFHQQPPPHGGGQAAQHHMIQQLLQDMNSNNGGGGPKPSVSGQSGGGGSMRYGGGGGGGGGPTRSNSFKGPSQSDTSAGGGKAGDIDSGLIESGFFNNDDFEDTMGYGWKE